MGEGAAAAAREGATVGRYIGGYMVFVNMALLGNVNMNMDLLVYV